MTHPGEMPAIAEISRGFLAAELKRRAPLLLLAALAVGVALAGFPGPLELPAMHDTAGNARPGPSRWMR